ncbi:hypothetical protein SLOPH_992 [Spraguea lophii 42_110]|uniref:Uncharacterized protein n=1 Tax=Spraguea lophii (strain 42_110) TaxID=1358809 RepID=S7XSH0_SPRLO|nr:hypothetical protein SLOPH_992 [Spraguea lophii 42_110]
MYPCVYSKDKKKHKKWIDGYITYNNDIMVLYTEYKRKIISKIIKIKDDEEIRIGFYYIYTDNLEQLIENNYNDNNGKMDDDKIDNDNDDKIDNGKGDNNININTNNNNNTNNTNISNTNNHINNRSVRKGFFSAYKRMKGNDEINNNDSYNNNDNNTTDNINIEEEYKIKKRTDEEILKLLE